MRYCAFTPTLPGPAALYVLCDTGPPRLVILTSCLIGGLATQGNRLNASAQSVPLIFPNSLGFINCSVHEKGKKKHSA